MNKNMEEMLQRISVSQLNDMQLNAIETIGQNDETILLTKKEFLILKMLCESIGRFYSREEILNHVWNDESYVLIRTVDVHIARLRKKLGDFGNHIINRPGFGYCFE